MFNENNILLGKLRNEYAKIFNEENQKWHEDMSVNKGKYFIWKPRHNIFGVKYKKKSVVEM